MLWLHLYFPQLPLEVFNLDNADKQAVVIIEKQRICRANGIALELGIQPGGSLATARALCGDLQALERRPHSEHILLGNLADQAYRFSSMVCVDPPDGLTLEVAASERLFGSIRQLLRDLEQRLRERGISAQSGLAPGPEGARLLARVLPCTADQLPPWLEETSMDGYRNQVAGLGLEHLECHERQQQRMRQAGFELIGDILALPRSAIARRFGQPLLDYLGRLNVEQPDPRTPYVPAEHFTTELHFSEPLRDNHGLLFPMQRLLRDLHGFLERRQAHAQLLEWRFNDVDGARHALDIPCSLPNNDLHALNGLTRLAMESFRSGAMIDGLQLNCRRFSRTEQDNGLLFADLPDGSGSPDDSAMALLLDRLRMRLGSNQLHGIAISDSHIPEYSCTATDVSGNTVRQKTYCPEHIPTRPCWLLPEPQPLHQRNRQLYWKSRLLLLSGPERIHGNWWETTVERDYYIARHEEGQLCWIYLDRLQHRWFIHGLFG